MKRILVLGAGGQIGTELVPHLQNLYGKDNVIGADLKDSLVEKLRENGIGEKVDATDAQAVADLVKKYKADAIFNLVALLSATGEKNPQLAWNINMGALLNSLNIAKEYGLEKVFVHCFMDGRDTDPESGKGFVGQVVEHCKQSAGVVATVIGRYYGMDRNNNWDRIKVAYDMLTQGIGKKSDDMVRAIQESYDEGVTDEFIKPIVNTTVDGRIQEGDVVIFFNFRNDRAKQITIALTQEDKPNDGMTVIKGLQYYCMTPYDPTFKDMHILYPKENIDNTLSEYLSGLGKRQLHIAETEKYAHVTFFFSGGREQPFENEDRILVPSPDVATYDLKPEMSAFEVRDKLVAAIREDKYDFIVVNYANGDMVGHTGVYNAITNAVKAVDRCVHDTVEAARATGYEVIIIADHGNADHAINSDGTPNTAHSLNPVPIIYVTENPELIINTGRLADVAPSILQIMDLPQPKEMTGHGLIDVTK